jgi:hypothetical protein
MSENSIETLLRRNVREVFNQRDGAARRAAIDVLYDEQAVFADHFGRNVGRAAIDAAVEKLLDRMPGFVLEESGEPQVVEGAGRVRWRFGPPAEPEKIRGEDFIVVRDGKISALYVFIDTPLEET